MIALVASRLPWSPVICNEQLGCKYLLTTTQVIVVSKSAMQTGVLCLQILCIIGFTKPTLNCMEVHDRLQKKKVIL